MSESSEQIRDKEELIQVRKQAARVVIKALLAALVFTFLAWSIPSL